MPRVILPSGSLDKKSWMGSSRICAALIVPPRRLNGIECAVTSASCGAMYLTLLLEKIASSSARDIFGSRPSTKRKVIVLVL